MGPENMPRPIKHAHTQNTHPSIPIAARVRPYARTSSISFFYLLPFPLAFLPPVPLPGMGPQGRGVRAAATWVVRLWRDVGDVAPVSGVVRRALCRAVAIAFVMHIAWDSQRHHATLGRLP